MKAINHTNQILAALNHEETDTIPCYTLGQDGYFLKDFYAKIGFTNQEVHEFSKKKLFSSPPVNQPVSLKLGFNACWDIATPPLTIKDQKIVDTWGCYYVMGVDGDIPLSWYNGPYLTSIEKIKAWWDEGWPRPISKNYFKGVKHRRETFYNDYSGFCILSGVSGPYECLSMSLGLGFMAKLMRKNPSFIDDILARNWAVQKKSLKRLLKTGQKIVKCGDDYGMNAGLMLDIKKWRKYIKPYLQKYVELVHDYNAKFILHSCGKIESLFPDFIDIGIDGVQSLKPYSNDLPQLKKDFGDKITFLGGIDDTHLLLEATHSEIYTTVQKLCKIMGKNGGWIPGPTNFISNVPVENIQVMIKAIKETKL